MIPLERLKVELHSKSSRPTKLLMLLADLETPASVARLRSRASEVGFRIPSSWNISSILARTNGSAVKSIEGWEITEKGIGELESLKLISAPHSKKASAHRLADLASGIGDKQVREFIQEAVGTYLDGHLRSAVVMSWLAAISVLHTRTISDHLVEFNREALRVNHDWRPARSTDDLGRMNEAQFLDRLAAISVLGKNVKTELKQCLDRRNACGHPNSYRLGESIVEHHLEVLILNVFEPFAQS